MTSTFHCKGWYAHPSPPVVLFFLANGWQVCVVRASLHYLRVCFVSCGRLDADSVAARPGLGISAGGEEIPHLLSDCSTSQVNTLLWLLLNLLYSHLHIFACTHVLSHILSLLMTLYMDLVCNTKPPPHTHTHTHAHACRHKHMHACIHAHTHTHTVY